MKRACDTCIERKVKCDGRYPCWRCSQASSRCSYLKPASKRGPKKKSSDPFKDHEPSFPHRRHAHVQNLSRGTTHNTTGPVPTATLLEYISFYKSLLYSVWPVVDSDVLARRLKSGNEDVEAYVLAVALSAATASQLQLPQISPDPKIDASYMAAEAIKGRGKYDYRERPSYDAILISFFLHVYYATQLKYRTSMMFLQEAMSFAKLLQMEKSEQVTSSDSQEGFFHTLYCLLWVTERGYAFQCNYPISSVGRKPTFDETSLSEIDCHQQGLLHLAGLFATYGTASNLGEPRGRSSELSPEILRDLQERISAPRDYVSALGSVRYVDYVITQNWMRTMLWQKSMAQGMLSSAEASAESMKYNYPIRVMRDLLLCIPNLDRQTIIAGGQDHLSKLFEISNTFADVILCCSTASNALFDGMCSVDLLFVLYAGLSPCLHNYPIYHDILCGKIEEIRLKATLLTVSLHGDEAYQEEVVGDDYPEFYVG